MHIPPSMPVVQNLAHWFRPPVNTEIWLKILRGTFPYEELLLTRKWWHFRISIKAALGWHYTNCTVHTHMCSFLVTFKHLDLQSRLMTCSLCLLPDAVLVNSGQVFVSGLVIWGPTVQVLETFPGTDALLSCLLGNVQLPAKCQAALGAVVYKQHRVTVMALQKQEITDLYL